MRFYKPADYQPCYYCEKKEAVEKGYPVREGVYTFENYVFRCAWHARLPQLGYSFGHMQGIGL